MQDSGVKLSTAQKEFEYLVSVVQKNGDIKKGFANRI